VRLLIGDMSDRRRLLAGLGLPDDPGPDRPGPHDDQR
jgi:hypothetical protein